MTYFLHAGLVVLMMERRHKRSMTSLTQESVDGSGHIKTADDF